MDVEGSDQRVEIENLSGNGGETAIVVGSAGTEVDSGEGRDLNSRSGIHEENNGSTEEGKKIHPDVKSCAVVVVDDDVKRDEESKVCRICHLSSENSLSGNSNLIQLGCGCKDELSMSHGRCAEAWFRIKGNRQCEICGETVKNVTGIMPDSAFMVNWNQTSLMPMRLSSQDRDVACWRRQPFCNFLLACLVILFMLPWFFRISSF
ncbi:Zinc finger, RING-CH-type [Dillenia turbinata]|uniref:Zinc finger, RING-CH-type n=1 Tax=Dillenia turbinata TaxID=194707 RepID=A0AAN8V2B4_9MAGN